MWGRSKFIVLTAAGWLAASGAEAADCKFAKYFDLPVDMEGRIAVVSTKIDGQDARFEVDTGAFFSTLTPEAAERVKLRHIPSAGLTISGVGGSDNAWVGEASEFNFAGVPLKNVQFVVAPHFHTSTVGLLGENLLAFADVEFDFAHGVMRYFRAQNCHDRGLAYWADGNYGVIPIEPFSPPTTYHIKGTVLINGKPVRAMFDSGAGATVLTRRAAERAGINMGGPDVKSAGLSGGIGRGVIENWTVPIASFAIGDEEIKNTRMMVTDKLGMDDTEMLVGIDFFLSHHLLVSRSQNKLYFSYNGGPVFRLDQPPPPSSSDKPRAAAGQAPSPGADKPQDADTLGRQGAALMSRHDYPGALQAFDKAVDLDPKSAKRYLERARAEHALFKNDLAKADLDRALALDPKDVSALLGRGDLDLGDKDLAHAAARFADALKAAPDDGGLELRIATLYERHRRWAETLPHYDAWIAAHPKDDHLWEVLNNRCSARAKLGKDLDKALDDCNASLKKGPRNSEVLDTRGMVYLRLGRLPEAIADYDAALKLQPKLPWSLYGRGLAKQRLGKQADGDADIKAALALSPNLEAEARRIGLIEPAPAKAKPESKTEPEPEPESEPEA